VTYADRHTDEPKKGDVFYWPPGHTVRADQDSEFILFSPHKEHQEVLAHVKAKLEG
jgi:hypothetical protein